MFLHGDFHPISSRPCQAHPRVERMWGSRLAQRQIEQHNRLRHIAQHERLAALHTMKLETAGSIGFDQISEQQLRDAFANDQGRGEFVILSQKSEVYIQASGEDDGPYALEYRDGGDDHHFSAGESFRKAEVLQAFLWYLAGDPRWRSEFSWQKPERKPWWRFW